MQPFGLWLGLNLLLFMILILFTLVTSGVEFIEFLNVIVVL
jgi:hypothetical protein